MGHPAIWLVVGFVGQALFSARFLVQWLASERARTSVIPVAFWWLSMAGSMSLLMYAASRGDPVIIVGQSIGVVVYARNLFLLRERERSGRGFSAGGACMGKNPASSPIVGGSSCDRIR